MTTRRLLILVLVMSARTAGAQTSPVMVPLCTGLQVVTAVNQANGDYESIKSVESISDAGVRLKYSSERLVEDMWSNEPPKLVKGTVYRTVRHEDLASARLYQQQFSVEVPETIPDTTAIGTSAAVLRALKTKGDVEMGIFQAFGPVKVGLDRGVHPNVYDNQMVVKVARATPQPVMIPVLVNDVLVQLPTIHATGDFFGDKSEFFFLDDERNPLALRFRVGIDAFKGGGAGWAATLLNKPLPVDRDTLQVIKISHRCATPPLTAPAGTGAALPPQAGALDLPAGSGGAQAIEQALASTGKLDVYSIFFTFNSDVIREESEPTLKDIAEVLRRHPDWRLSVNGHTDGIGTDQANQTLSARRSAAVRDALVTRFGIVATRLATAGFGESRPMDTNETLEGRARNRRVELMKLR